MKENPQLAEAQIRSLAPEERAQLLLRLTPVLAAVLVGFALIDLFRGWISVAIGELIFAAGLWQALRITRPIAASNHRMLSQQSLVQLHRAELLLVISSLPLFWLLLLDPGVGHASMFGLVLGPAAWYIAGGARIGRIAAAVYAAGWALLALVRAFGAFAGDWLYGWEEWAAGFSIWLLAVAIFDARERAFESRRKKALEHDAAITAFLDRLPLGVGVWSNGEWLYRNPTMQTLCVSPTASPVELLGEKTWLHLIRDGELDGTWRCGEIKRPVKLISISVPWQGRQARALLVVDETAARELERLRREEMLASLAAGVAHHFNNLFAGVLGAAEIVAAEAKSDEAKDALRIIEDSSERGTRICRELVRFAKRKPEQQRTIHPAEWLRRVSSVLRIAVPPSMELILSADRTAPIRADVRDLEEIVLRFVRNAVEASEGKGEVRVAITQVHLTNFAGWYGRGTPGDYVVFSVSDRGKGMGTTTLEEALSPFFSGKSPAHAGMGLAAAWGLVQRHDGILRIHPRKGGGMEVEAAFPALAEPAALAKKTL